MSDMKDQSTTSSDKKDISDSTGMLSKPTDVPFLQTLRNRNPFSSRQFLRQLLATMKAVRRGDFSPRLPYDMTGLEGEVADVFNDIIEMNFRLEQETQRVSRQVALEGQFSQRIHLESAGGGWRRSADAINQLVDGLVQPVTETSRVITAVANGDLKQQMLLEVEGRPLRGEFQRIAQVINNMVDQLQNFSGEVTRITRQVGVDGRLGVQAEVEGVAGVWRELTDNVNTMASTLTNQVREISEVTVAVAQGNLERKITVEARGEIADLKNTINTMVDQLNVFSREVNRVAREVGTEGVLGGQAVVPGVSGIWAELSANLNSMASNLTSQVRGISKVVGAVARGDLRQRLSLEAKGEIADLATVINDMTETLGVFSSEVTRVARKVGTEGVLGEQAEVPRAEGIWRELTDNVNAMASSLTEQVRNIADVTTAVANGDLSRKITVDARGEIAELKATINTMVDSLNLFSQEVTRVAREVGTEGVLGGQAKVSNVSGVWLDLTENVNAMATNLTNQIRGVVDVVTAIAKGDLRQRLRLEAKGEVADLVKTINEMTDTLNRFAGEVTRVAREVGIEGSLGGQADVMGAEGTWRDLTDNVNGMATNLTNQVRNIAEVATAVANGDLTKTITVDARGEVEKLKNTINEMVDRLNIFGSEVTRVAREVGTEGVLGGQAEVPNVSGIWAELTSNVNGMASNLTSQVRNIAEVTTAVARGDLTRQITVEARGEVQQLATTINTMVDTLAVFSEQVTEVARQVGTEGILGGQAEVKAAEGIWRDLTDNVNGLAANLTSQVRNIAEVTTAVANGDLTRKITVGARGEVAELKTTINAMVDRLNVFGSEVTRVAREVGTEGVLGGQAAVPDVAGIWAELTDNVNGMASNLTNQVRNIADVTTAVAKGDLSRKITVEARGEVQLLADTINTMVDTLAVFSEQVTEVARQVGTEGVLGGQAEVKAAEGTWRDLTDNVNYMAANLTNQVRNIAEVATAVANGDLARKITVDARGEVAELKTTINSMVDRLNVFGSEVTRVAREVGTEGVLGGQAEVPDVAGIWAELTDNVNGMANNLTNQVRNIAEVTTAVAKGDLTRQITVEARGEVQQLATTINTMVDTLAVFSEQVTEVARQVGTEGVLGGQAEVKAAEGIWRDLTDNVNSLAANLTNQVRNIAEVTTAVAIGDLTKKITVDARGEVADLKTTINAMVDRLSVFGSEVTRVAREVGTDGVLGGQAEVPDVAGIWSELTENVNGMALNLTNQVRNIAEVTTAVAKGDLTRKITVQASGEVQQLAATINTMVDTLAVFSEQVTEVARQVGTEGVLGGQAEVEEAQGVWRDLTDNVNTMAANLTNQVRAIADVATAVTQGDLTRAIDIEAQGEIEELSNNINTMIASLQKTTSENENINWLQTGIGQLNDVMRGEQEVADLASKVVSQLAKYLGAQIGTVYLFGSENTEQASFKLIGSYAYSRRKGDITTLKPGEGLAGQAILEKKPILVEGIPENYIRIGSSLGDTAPTAVLATPFLFEGEVKGVIELGFLTPPGDQAMQLIGQVMDSIAIGFDSALSRTQLNATLKQSQSLAEELQTQQEELKESNEQLEEQTRALESAQKETDERNRQLEEAQSELNERAEQLALSSKYKSEFLANMSHELRTPLNSILLLSQTISSQQDKADNDEIRRHAKIIHGAGTDLLQLINEVLDLAKIEAGKMSVRLTRLDLHQFSEQVMSLFKQQAEQKGLTYRSEIDIDAPQTILSDKDRIQQVIRNFLSNAFKFTEVGSIRFQIHPVQPSLIAHAINPGDTKKTIQANLQDYVAFSVIDTGIGIPENKFQIIFEAFQQMDGTTSRKYGGTGLGLSISRQIADMLEGIIALESQPGQGSTFSLILPRKPSHYLTSITHQEDSDIEAVATRSTMMPKEVSPSLQDDQGLIKAGDDRLLLVIEDDPKFAKILMDLGRKNHFKVIIAGTGTEGVRLVEKHLPAAVILDIQLPVMDGWEVLRHLKKNNATRHIPVHVISVIKESIFGYRLGAAQYLVKPISKEALDHAFEQIEEHLNKKAKHLLIVEDNDVERQAVVNLLKGEDIVIRDVATGKEALTAIREIDFDTMVLDLKLPDMDGYDLLRMINQDGAIKHLPTIVYTGKDLTMEDERKLRQYAESIVLKTAESPARLLEETTIFLHRVAAELSQDKQALLKQITYPDSVLEGKTVLVVDDDIRNTYALSTVLENRGLTVLTATDGQQAIEMLENHPEIDLVLMDIMMPVMNGLEATQAIRKQPQHADLPVIALTAKALKEDRDQCIAAGASDYMSKPVDHEQLFSLIRVWLSVNDSQGKRAENEQTTLAKVATKQAPISRKRTRRQKRRKSTTSKKGTS
ncbi:HAMP domain-containing protein [Magnetococcales bacterium HHB-1]